MSYPNTITVLGNLSPNAAGIYNKTTNDGNGNPRWVNNCVASYIMFYPLSSKWVISFDNGVDTGIWQSASATLLNPIAADYAPTGSETGTAELRASPQSPVISASYLNNDITVSITGEAGAVHFVFAKLHSSNSWVFFNKRIGDGDISVLSLPAGSYDIICYSMINGLISEPSNIAYSIVQSSSVSSVKEFLYGTLTGDAGIYSVVSGRVYPQVIPQNTALPSIVYHNITTSIGHDLKQRVDLTDTRWQFDCVATTRAAADNLASLVVSCLDSYSGTSGSLTIPCIQVIDIQDAIEEDSGVDLLRRFKSIVEVRLWYKN